MNSIRAILRWAAALAICICMAELASAQSPDGPSTGWGARPVARRASTTKQDAAGALIRQDVHVPVTRKPVGHPQTSSPARFNIADEALPAPDSPLQRPEPLPPAEQSETCPGLTLADLEGIAFSSNPTLIQANAAIRAAQGQYLQTGLPPNPNVGWSAMMMGDAGTAGQQGPYFEQMFILGGKLRLNREVEGQRVQQTIARRDGQVQMVLNDVRIGYYNVLVAQRTLQLAQQLVEIGEEGVKAADNLLSAGRVSRVDLLQARVEANTARIQYRNARNRHAAAWRSLSAVIGAPGMPATYVAGNVEAGLPVLDWDTSLLQILAASPELAEARAGIGRTQFSLARARRQPFPDADIQYFPQRDYAGAQDVHSAQAYLVMPLWNQNQGNIRTAQAELTAAKANALRVELDLQNRLAAAFERYANARQQADTYSRQILPDAKESLDLVANGYRQGEFSYLILLTAQRTYFNTNLDYLVAIQALRENAVAIEGLLLTGSLEKSP